MDDMNAFERQVVGQIHTFVGPPRPVDDAAIFTAITVTQSPRWRFQSMFSATKFVVAGAIVALFGGFLLAGLLAQQPSEDRLPAVGASASATTQAEPTDAATGDPEPTAKVEGDTTTTSDLLPAVDLVTEEVEPGVYRVVSDGVRDLARVADSMLNSSMVAGLDGSVWSFGPDDFFRLGDEDTYTWSEQDVIDGVWPGSDLGVAPDGTLMVFSDPEHAAVFDGRSWIETTVEPTTPTVWLRGDGLHFYVGERWKILPTPFSITTVTNADIGSDGTIWIRHQGGADFLLLARYRLSDPNPGWEEFSTGLPLMGGEVYQGFGGWFRAASDGSLWYSPREAEDTGCGGLARFDGGSLTRYLRGLCMYTLDVALDGAVWVQAGHFGDDARPIDLYVITPEAVGTSE